MAITSHDVARLAGVSQPTVSRALRGSTRVAAETRAKVAAAARKLDYRPSDAGRSLRTRETRQVAMVADLDNPLYPRLVGPIHDALAGLGYRMVVLAERGDEVATYERLLDRSVDAAILTTTLLRSALPHRLADKAMPFVQLNRTSDLVDADSVTAANADGAAAAARMLLDAGHRRIGALLGPTQTSTARDREAGFRDALSEAGVALPPRWTYRGWFTYQDGADGLRAIMRRADRPTALFCSNDIVAVGALNAAVDAGIHVPGDVSLVGFDDLDVAAWPCFRLSTIHVDHAGMAARAAQLLVARLGAPDSPPVREVHPVRPVPRATVATPAATPAGPGSPSRRPKKSPRPPADAVAAASRAGTSAAAIR